MENYFEMHFTPAEVNTISNVGLAHLGDSVYEILVRAWLCSRGEKTVLNLHRKTVEMVRAPAQAKFAEKLKPHLTEQETAYYRRGKNSHTHAAPKSATVQEYAMATGLETLFGALYLQGKTERLNELFHILIDEED